MLIAVAALALLAVVVSAQTNATYIDPNVVPDTTRAQWCSGQENVCLTLCNKAVDANGCNPSDLTFNCTCASNHSAPDLKDYINSMPWRICEESYGLCNQNNAGNQTAQDECTTNIKDQCGTLDIANYTPPASTSTVQATATAATTGGPASTTAASTSATKSSAADAALIVGKNYGSSIIAAALVAAFGFMV